MYAVIPVTYLILTIYSIQVNPRNYKLEVITYCLNLRGGFKKDILDYIRKKHPDLVPLYDAIYNKRDRSYFRGLEEQAERLAKEYRCPFVDNELPYGRAEPGHPVIVDYFYHEEVRGSENTGRRNPKK